MNYSKDRMVGENEEEEKEVMQAIIILLSYFAIVLFVKIESTLQLILTLVAYILLGKEYCVLKAVKNVEKGPLLLMKEFLNDNSNIRELL